MPNLQELTHQLLKARLSHCRTKASQDYQTKSGNPTPFQQDPIITHTLPGDASNREALKSIAALSLLGLGTGMGVRGLFGLGEWLGQHRVKKPQPRPAVLEVAVPQITREDEEKKASNTTSYVPPSGININVPRAANTWDWLTGRTYDSWLAKPWFLTAALGLPALGLYSGYRGMDSLMDTLRKKDKDDELNKAKEEYRKALMEQYSTESNAKFSSDSSISADLSKLYNRYKESGYIDKVESAATQVVEKKAFFEDPIGNLRGAVSSGVGAYIPLALLLGGGSALATYNWVKSRQPEKRLAEVIKQRERLRWATKPPEIYAVQKPIPVTVVKNDESDEKEEDTQY